MACPARALFKEVELVNGGSVITRQDEKIVFQLWTMLVVFFLPDLHVIFQNFASNKPIYCFFGGKCRIFRLLHYMRMA